MVETGEQVGKGGKRGLGMRKKRNFFSSRPRGRNSARGGSNERDYPLPLGSSVSARFSVSSELLLPLSRRKETDLCTGQSIVRAWPRETTERMLVGSSRGR